MVNVPLLWWLSGRPFASFAADTDDGGDQDDYCSANWTWNMNELCDYAMTTDACSGGGYVEWTTFVMCADTVLHKWLLVAAGIVFLFCLFLFISAAADQFFSPNISSIVSHLKISENVAGVTFMAFGNGAADVFNSVASVLSSPKPKAGLAIGELFGGATFVTLCVTASIVLARPFKAPWSTLRDLIFLIFAVAWILFVFLYSNEVYIWQPLVFIGAYAIYVCIVIGGAYIESRRRKNEHSASKATSFRSRRTSVHSKFPDIQTMDDCSHTKADLKEEEDEVRQNRQFTARSSHKRDSMAHRLSVSISHVLRTNEEVFEREDPTDEEFIVLHNKVYHGEEARTRANTHLPVAPINSPKALALDLWNHLKPFAHQEEDDQPKNLFDKIMAFIMIPFIFLLKITIPLSEAPWSKPIAFIHALLAPMWFLVCIQSVNTPLFTGSPGLWAYALLVSAVIIVLLFFFTDSRVEPRFYKPFCAYLGFLISVAWIYAISSEVVDAIDMLGIVSGISPAVLGITIIAWSNSISDMISDVAVARQGYPGMAIGASIGGPLFNILIGFGVPFTIAKAKGDIVTITFTSVYKFMVLFLGISIIYSTVVLITFKANLRRWYAFGLIGIYIAFLILVILAELKVIVW